ncbi:MAG: alpha/beta hydrolase family protein, partial [Planctomycetota bacterium]|nr:alpha/beta hydrolase family protein [Planctomycetota bacterium]
MNAPLTHAVESVVRFGAGQRLIGIATPGNQSGYVTDRPAVVIFNAGIVHRVGPFRLSVDLARELAEAGFCVLRFDLSGLGESDFRGGRLEAEERALLDAQDAFRFMHEEFGTSAFVTAGLCSGAFNAFQVAVGDRRVRGLISMDGVSFETGGFRRREVTRRLNYRFVRNAIKRRALGIRGYEASDPASQLTQGEFFQVDENPDRVRRQLGELVQRRVAMQFVYTEGCDDFNGEAQFEEMFGPQPKELIEV